MGPRTHLGVISGEEFYAQLFVQYTFPLRTSVMDILVTHAARAPGLCVRVPSSACIQLLASREHGPHPATAEVHAIAWAAHSQHPLVANSRIESWLRRKVSVRRSLHACLLSLGKAPRFMIVAAPAPCAFLPSRSWQARLISLENKYIRLISMNAYVSTLGGGHFLCKQVSQARSMALTQRRIAIALGNLALEAMTLVHLVYADVQVGNFRRAMRCLRRIARFAEETGDGVLGKMAESGQRFCRRTYALWAAGVLDDGDGGYQGRRHAEFAARRAVTGIRGSKQGLPVGASSTEGQVLLELPIPAGGGSDSGLRAAPPQQQHLTAVLQAAGLPVEECPPTVISAQGGGVPDSRYDELYRLRLVRGGGGALPGASSGARVADTE